MAKRYAEIGGHNWQVGYPFCAGCPELVMCGTCAHEGNGCRYPDERKKMPVSYARAFFALANEVNDSGGVESVAARLGPCLPRAE